ncbi:hypothetical protein ACIPYQ_05150 [Streptomyces sp. NPDC090045]|uniref:hypothetical protein n=1 Tax=Streptomyces sp. NPDC090045 TaxID=3365927 RepID=UPI003823ABBE
MAWRDRLRRRAAVPDAATDRAAAPTAPNTADAPVAAAPVTGVPGDWDGGWRMTAPPALTVSRAALGVSDGLAFRSGLAAWRDPSFDTGLAHALLPSAPAGLVRGVTRPAAARPGSTAGGGPLLLRALRQPDAAEQPPAPGAPGPVRPDAPSSRPSSPGGRGASTPVPAVQRAAATGGRSAVTPAAPDRAPTPPRFPLIRRIAVVPDASATRGASAGRAATPPSGPPVQRSAARPSGSTGGTGGETPATAAVRPRAVGRTLTVARVPATPRRRVPAVRPALAAPVQRAENRTPLGTPVPDTSGQGAEGRAPLGTAASDTPGQGAGSRAPLGTPVTELPSTATPSDRPATPSAPAMPMVQRQVEPAAADNSATKPTAQRQAEPSAKGAGTPGNGATKPRAEQPTVQREADPSAKGATAPGNGAPTPGTTGPDTPVQRAGNRPPLGTPLTELPSTATPSDHPATASAPTPALPVVQRLAEPSAEGGTAPGNGRPKPGAQRPAEPAAGPGAPLQRAEIRPPLGTPLTGVPATAVPSDHPATAPTPAPAMPVVQRQPEPTTPGNAAPKHGATSPGAPVQRQADPTAKGAATPGNAAPKHSTTGPDAPVQRAGNRPPLGTPLTEVPSTATPSGRPATASTPAPALPVVQRQAEPATSETGAQRPAEPTAGPGTPGQRAGSRPPLGAPLTELPNTATPSGQPAPAPAPAPALPVVQRQAEPAAPDTGGANPGAQRQAEPTAGPGVPVQRAQSRPPLGAPLTELPATATPSGRSATASAPTPALPVVQRQAEPATSETGGAKPGAQRQAEPTAGPGAPGQRAGSRPPLGAPLTELPATAVPSGRSAAASAPAPALPVVQRQAEPSAGDSTGPQPAEPTRGSGQGRSAPRIRTGLGAPLPSMPPSAAPPVSPAHRARAARPASPADVQRAPAPLLGAGGVPRRTGAPGTPSGSGRPVPLVVARTVTDKPVGASAAASSRALQLLAARPLPLGTRDMGSAAPPAPRPASRPVVAARWPAPSAAPQQVQRAAVDGPRGGHVVRPARGPRHAPASAPARAAATPLPVTSPHTPPLVVQPAPAVPSAQSVPVVRPRTPAPTAVPGAASPAAPAPAPTPTPTAAPVQRTPGGPRTGPAPAGGGTPDRHAPADRHAAPQVPDADLDDLARRLLDPVSRLLRTELRRGRERAGRPFDGRR